MSRESCIIVRAARTATYDQRELIRLAIAMRDPAFDYDRDCDDMVVFVDAPHSVTRTKKAIMHALAESEVADAVITPPPVGVIEPGDDGYTYRDWFDEPVAPEPAVPADEITVGVTLKPASPFQWHALRDELAALGRQVIGDSDSNIEIGARSASDADELIADLKMKSLIRAAEAEPLGRFRRWRVRQQLLGNYAGVDPTQRF